MLSVPFPGVSDGFPCMCACTILKASRSVLVRFELLTCRQLLVRQFNTVQVCVCICAIVIYLHVSGPECAFILILLVALFHFMTILQNLWPAYVCVYMCMRAHACVRVHACVCERVRAG